MVEQPRLRWFLSLLVFVGVARFVWIPLTSRIQTQASQLNYLKQLSETKKQSLSPSVMTEGDPLLDLEQEWEQLAEGMYSARSPFEAGMSMLEYARRQGVHMGIDIRSSLLLPSVLVGDDLHIVSSEITVNGSFEAVLGFVQVLSRRQLPHSIRGLTVERTLTGNVTTTFRLSALANIAIEDSRLVKGFTFYWRLAGIIHQRNKATALFVHTLTEAEAFVQAGDQLGDNEQIVEVGVNFVRILDGDDEITLTTLGL